jgi:hypothetical protein
VVNQAADRDLLRRFEPVVRFTKGECFFPMDVDAYVRSASLWVLRPGQEPTCLVPRGGLSLERLAEPQAEPLRSVLYLKFIEPLTVASFAAYRLQEVRRLISQRGGESLLQSFRLSRVGYGPRLLDALFSLTLLARGRVPGDTAAAAVLEYRRMQQECEHYRYFGRVVREGGWIILQYWFCYAFNDWRSGFSGANDHEGGWESIHLYLTEQDDGAVSPAWAAYAAHRWSGDDLRRRWDDPELEKVGEHPVVYAAGGSHACYFAPGDYVAELELPFLSPLARFSERVRAAWRKFLRQQPHGRSGDGLYLFRVPFVDYARGDGLAIGPGQGREWDEPGLLSPPPQWVLNFRGLWGLYVRDPFAGEDAPAGPMYNQNGMVRRLWHNPVGWAGLDKVQPPHRLQQLAQERSAALADRRVEFAREIDQKSAELVALGVETAAMRRQPHLRQRYAAHQEQIRERSRELDEMRAQLASEEALIVALETFIQEHRQGRHEGARTHLRRPHRPSTESALRLNRLAEFWAAISVGLAMIGILVLAVFARRYLLNGSVAILALFVLIEAGFRRRITDLANGVAIALAGVAAAVFVYEFWFVLVVGGVLSAGAFLIWKNLRELG